MSLRGKIVVKKDNAHGLLYTKFHGESGLLYYAYLKPKRISTLTEYECNVFLCTTEGDNNSGIEWGHVVYKKQCDDITPNTLRKCIEDFLGYPVDMIY